MIRDQPVEVFLKHLILLKIGSNEIGLKSVEH